jgi:hypothetical protein
MDCVAWGSGRAWSGTSNDPMPAWERKQRAEFQARAERTFTPDQLSAMGDLSEPLRTVKASADRVAHDFTSTTGVDMDYIVCGPEDNGSYLCGNGPMASYVPGGDLEEFVAAVADSLGQWVTETLANMGRIEDARTWPRCPEHDHALDPVVLGGIAEWTCRDNRAIAIRTGDLTAAPRPNNVTG